MDDDDVEKEEHNNVAYGKFEEDGERDCVVAQDEVQMDDVAEDEVDDDDVEGGMIMRLSMMMLRRRKRVILRMMRCRIMMLGMMMMRRMMMMRMMMQRGRNRMIARRKILWTEQMMIRVKLAYPSAKHPCEKWRCFRSKDENGKEGRPRNGLSFDLERDLF